MKHIVDMKMCTMAGAPAETVEKRLRRLEDRESICEALYHYANSTDTCDPDGQASCFAEHGVLKWGDNFKDWYVGREQIREHFRAAKGAVMTGTHLITNVQILFESDDSAIVHAYFYAWQHFKDYPRKSECHTLGRYEAQVIREDDGEWRFQSFYVVTAAQQGGYRGCEQFTRPWPPRPILADGTYRKF
ncbi:MAG: nuclear transport factor 2 family protein [Oscillospiraceae bacterium]